ncbi:phospholipid/cholesterol/gamma-HCH transport system substrate-binding protein [Thermomonospora echinospora]|uniref:Phospholipid/cholesterol/gamma-HCH transport system substrate-binding protein n=1 Tax=Thermomonospora echinospora TaxID=1992 RepID=A0A1H5VMI7_9ACTN|nr:MCE family protein [Thermomonospora echinospora]SEF88532.1 phospholipid/cholesterol/gamma-HCH transport system substrate-binding protein [Thermomonospora echinospora]
MSEENLSLRSRLLYGAIGTAVLVSGAAVALVGSQPDHSGATYYTASFGRAGQGLDHRSDVKVRGITVGGIDSVSLEPGGRVKVRIRIDEDLRITRDALAAIEPVSVFGPKDLTIDMGGGDVQGPYLPEGGTITRTKDPEELSDVAWPAYRLTGALDPQDIATLLHTFSQGLNGQGPALRRSIDNGTKLLDVAYDRRAEIQRLIDDIAALSGTLGGRGDTITGLARDFNALSPALNDRPDKVAELLDQAGRLSDQVSGTLQRHGGDIAEIIDGGGRAVQVLYQERDDIPTLVTGLTGFFTLLSDIIRIKGPENSLLAQAVDFLPLDVCKIIIDVCRADPSMAGSYLKLTGGGR